jgi:tryptophan synthase beta subunit
MRLKVCGLTRREDVEAAVAAGAWALGFVCWPGSPRYVHPADIARITANVPPGVERIGVFVNAMPDEVDRVLHEAGLTGVQLHGDAEDPAAYRRTGRRVIRSVTLTSDAAVADARVWPSDVLVLVDAHDPVRRGGTGQRADWTRAAMLAADRPVLLAGGLSAGVIGDVAQQVRPWGVDVSSGVEQSPGIKDPGRLRELGVAMMTAEQGRAAGTPAFGHRDPDARGYFGEFGGRFIPETLVAPVDELTEAYFAARQDPGFVRELMDLLTNFVGRATPLYEARHLPGDSGVRVFFKREDLAHTGAHKINNAIGQALLARRMGKRRVVAETGAGQHGVATATACALLGLECVVYMGADDMARQALNVFRMRLLGATVVSVDGGSRTLKDAINEAMRDWVTNVEHTAYVLGSVLGPHPYPLMVREFQSVIGQEARAQILAATGRLPDVVVACVGGGSNAMGIFDAFVADTSVRLVGVEAGGRSREAGAHAARFAGGIPGVLHGTRSLLLQDEAGNILPTHSVSAGLDYPSIGPEHAWLASTGRTEYAWADDEAALEAFEWLARHEGLLPALESSHAAAWLRANLTTLAPGTIVIVNLSGRGDKDVESVRAAMAARSQQGGRS